MHLKILNVMMLASLLCACSDNQTTVADDESKTANAEDEIKGNVDVSSGHSHVTLTNNTNKDIYFFVLEGDRVGAQWTPSCSNSNKISPMDRVNLETDSPMTQKDDLEFVQVNWWHKKVINNTEVCTGVTINSVDVPIEYMYAPSANDLRDDNQEMNIEEEITEEVIQE